MMCFHVSHHDLYLTLLLPLWIDIWGHNQSPLKVKPIRIRQAHTAEWTMLCSKRVWLSIHRGIAQYNIRNIPREEST